METFPEIKGIIANKGYVSGPARIVLSKEDFSKIQYGDVIITKALTQELLPAIKDCVAIVTDDGDIDSYSAKIGRERGLPCIVGTKNATAVFKDDDMLIVDGLSFLQRKTNLEETQSFNTEQGVVRRI